MTQLVLFDYDALDAETRDVVQREDREFDCDMGESGMHFVRACHRLVRIQKALHYKRPGFAEYCDSKPGLSNQTAYRMIEVAEMFPESRNISIASKEALYMLSASSTPESARQKAIELAEAGVEITRQVARELVSELKDNMRVCPYCGRSYAGDGSDVTECPYCHHLHQYSGLRDTEKYGAYPVQWQPQPDVAPAPIGVLNKATGELFDVQPANHQLINQSTNNEWYTPRPFLDAAHEVMGGIDLDPASNAVANQAVRAARYYTIADNGYIQPWHGRVWLNPPYGVENGESNQARWSRRLLDEYRAGNVIEAILLVNAVPGNSWFTPLKDFPICFPDGRIRFYNDTTEAGQPTHSNALVYFGSNVARFVRVFSRFGAVMARLVARDHSVFVYGLETSDDKRDSVPG